MLLPMVVVAEVGMVLGVGVGRERDRLLSGAGVFFALGMRTRLTSGGVFFNDHFPRKFWMSELLS